MYVDGNSLLEGEIVDREEGGGVTGRESKDRELDLKRKKKRGGGIKVRIF